MPAVRGDGMRGLAVFISDIRNCKSFILSYFIFFNQLIRFSFQSILYFFLLLIYSHLI
jgi:hypothetical protein